MVALLLRKMRRDILKGAAAYLICVAVTAAGITGYSMMSITADRLELSRDSFFAATDTADAFAQVRLAPLDAARRLEAVDGVLSAEGRLTRRVGVSGLGGARAELKLVSLLEGGMNQPLLSQGMMPRAGQREMVVGERFLAARGLKLGDYLGLIIDGQVVTLEICGAGITPENIYMVKNLSDMLPDFGGYDGAFLHYDTLGGLLRQTGSATDFSLRLEPGVNFEDIKPQIERVLQPYGLDSAYERADQLSISVLQSELDGIRSMTGVLPFLFLGVAGIILYITLLRLIEAQRTQAGTLMALGLGRRGVAAHYTLYGGVVGLAGGAAGGAAGYFMSAPMFGYLREYFSLPANPPPAAWRYVVFGTAIATVFCALVGAVCARGLAELLPAQALRPAPPKRARRSVFERIPGFAAMLTIPGMMSVRSLARNRRRAALSVLGVSFAYMICAVLLSMNAMYDVFIFDPLEKSQRQDITVNFSRPIPRAEALAALRDEGVESAEGFAVVPARLRGERGGLDSMVHGVVPGGGLLRLYDTRGNYFGVQPGGIVLSRHAANVLGVEIGGEIELEVSYPREVFARFRVVGIYAEYMNNASYMAVDELTRAAGWGDVLTGAALKAPDDAKRRILSRLEDSQALAGVESRAERIAAMRAMMGSMGSIVTSMAVMGVLIGAAVIYTGSIVAFEELKREIAALRMLGLTVRESMDVISTGQWIASALGIVAGLPLTVGADRLLAVSFNSDMYSIPSFINAGALAWAAGLVFLSVLAGTGLIKRKLAKISPVELLGQRE
jgi:putative ABC transport system permease protein